MSKETLNHNDIRDLAEILVSRVVNLLGRFELKAYAIPRGGIPAAYAVQSAAASLGKAKIEIVLSPLEADFFIDDIIDSGATMQKFCDDYPGIPFFALIDKTDESSPWKNDWVVFPWEGDSVGSFEDNIVRLLQFVGEDAGREGLLETPKRVTKAWAHWCSGYGKDAASLLKVFEDGAEKYDQMVIVKDIPVYSHCEHHLAPIFGTASIAYIPNGKIVGLSKLSRLVDMFGRRLQVQERLTDQIADAIVDNLQPAGVGVIIKARHLCMESRGICQQGHHTVTTALRGAIKDEPQTRAEFLKLAN